MNHSSSVENPYFDTAWGEFEACKSQWVPTKALIDLILYFRLSLYLYNASNILLLLFRECHQYVEFS